MPQKTYWTLEKLICTIRQVMEDMEISHLPRYEELRARTGISPAVLTRLGGYKKIRSIMGVPFAPRRMPQKYQKTDKNICSWDQLEGFSFRRSRAFEIEAEARKEGLHYADKQIADTLRMVGRIPVEEYETLKE